MEDWSSEQMSWSQMEPPREMAGRPDHARPCRKISMSNEATVNHVKVEERPAESSFAAWQGWIAVGTALLRGFAEAVSARLGWKTILATVLKHFQMDPQLPLR